jgi:hypothetical protein
MASSSIPSVSAAPRSPIVIPDEKGEQHDLVTLFITVVGSGDPSKWLSQSSAEVGNAIRLLSRLDNGALSAMRRAIDQESTARRAKAALESIQSAIAECATALKNRRWDQLKVLLQSNGQSSDYGSYTRKAVIGNLAQQFTDAMKLACNSCDRSGRLGIKALCEVLVGDGLFFQILEICQADKWNVEGLILLLSQDVGSDMRMIDTRCKAVIAALEDDALFLRIYKTGTVPFLVKKSVLKDSSIPAQQYTQMRTAFIAKFHGFCSEGKAQEVLALLKNIKKSLPSDSEPVFGQAKVLAKSHEKVRIVLEAHLKACAKPEEAKGAKATS